MPPSINDIQHNAFSVTMLSVVMPNIVMPDIVMLSVVMLNIVMLSVEAPIGECNSTIMKRSNLQKCEYIYTSKIIYNKVGFLSI